MKLFMTLVFLLLLFQTVASYGWSYKEVKDNLTGVVTDRKISSISEFEGWKQHPLILGYSCWNKYFYVATPTVYLNCKIYENRFLFYFAYLAQKNARLKVDNIVYNDITWYVWDNLQGGGSWKQRLSKPVGKNKDIE